MQATLRRTGHSDLQSSDSTLHPCTDINAVWAEVRPLIQRVLDRMDDIVNAEDIYRDLLTNERQLWVISNGGIQAVILTMVLTCRKHKVGVLTHASGEDFRAWESSVDHIAEYFKTIGCTKFEIIGRRGWKKYMENRGFKETKIILERIL